jgi:prepilin signal peptidase PulO-like enzyme (type II secretory pathway)
VTADPPQRQPVTELVLFFIGGAIFVVATVVKWDALLIASIFLCVFAGFAALISTWLARQSRRIIALLTILGFVLTGIGVAYMVRDASEPVIFSPGLVLYPGGSLALSGLINLLSGQSQKPRRGSRGVTDRS